MELDDKDDFGLTFHDEDLQKPSNDADKLTRVMAVIGPFLHKLAQDPEKKQLVWDKRAEVVNGIIKKLEGIIAG